MSSEPRQVKPRHSRKEDVATTTNHVFQPLLLAGTGGIGDTWICVGNLPTTSSTSVLNTVSKRDGPKTLYAVKLPSRGKLDPLPQEITALKHVAAIPTPNNKHMQKYVDHDQLHKHATWLASQAVVGCTLWQLQKAAEAESIPLPKPLVLTIALQLCDALQALRDTQFFHGDLHGSNIMLDLEARDENGAPTVVVIDFGRGRPRKDAFEFDLDLSSFYRVVEGIASWEQGFKLGEDPPWDDFVRFVIVSNRSKFHKVTYERFRERFAGLCMRTWNDVSEEERTIINALLNNASKVMIWARSMAQKIEEEDTGR